MRRPRRRTLVGLTVVAAVIAALVVLREDLAVLGSLLATRVEAAGPWAPAAFLGIYYANVVLVLPISPLLLAAGFLFGPAQGIALAWAAHTAATCTAFLLSRRFFRERLRGLIRGRPRLEALRTVVEGAGLRTLVLVRASPLLPSFVESYGLGMMGVGFRRYFLASVSTLPIVGMWVLTGTALGSLGGLGSGTLDMGPIHVAALIVLLAMGFGAAILVARKTRRRLLPTAAPLPGVAEA